MGANTQRASSIQVANTKSLMTWACVTISVFFLVSISPWFLPSTPSESVSPFTVAITAINLLVFAWRRVWAGRALRYSRPKQAFRIRPSSNAVEPERKITTLSVLLIILFSVAMIFGKDGALPIPDGLAAIIVPLILITPLLDVFCSKADAWHKFLNGQNPD